MGSGNWNGQFEQGMRKGNRNRDLELGMETGIENRKSVPEWAKERRMLTENGNGEIRCTSQWPWIRLFGCVGIPTRRRGCMISALNPKHNCVRNECYFRKYRRGY